MSQETALWLNTMQLIGFTEKRGTAWHYRANLQDVDPVTGHVGNHYDGPIPVEHVRRRLFDWRAVEVVLPDVRTDEGVTVATSTHKAIAHGTTGELFGIFTAGYQPHQYQDRLLADVGTILDTHSTDLGIASAGLLKKGARAYVTVELPDTVSTPQGVEFRPFLVAAGSHDGSLSTTYKAAVQAVVCHATDTEIIDGYWRGKVQDHPTALESRHTDGFEIAVRGVPFTEKVSSEHRYWARQVERVVTPKRQAELGAVSSRVGRNTAPGWVEARELTPVAHEIGTPIDLTERLAPVLDDRISASDLWWLIGYWFGNGHSNSRKGSVSFSVPDHRPELIERIALLVKALGGSGNWAQKQGCRQITLTHHGLATTLSEFKRPGWAQKVLPVWVESISLELQRALVQGYYDADGSVDTTEGCILVSVSLDGLLGLRRILARLGIPSSIRRGSDPVLRSNIQGRQVHAQEQYSIRFWQNVAQLGYTTRFKGQFSHPYIEDGFLWSRVESIRSWEGIVWPITTQTHEYVTAFGLSHNCDNTLAAALSEEGRQIKIKHSRYSNEKVTDIRDALKILHVTSDAFAASVAELCETTVTDTEWYAFLDEYVPVPKDKGPSQSIADKKRSALIRMWTSDARVSPWRGTAFGVVQAGNTWMSHESTVRGVDARAERNMINAITSKSAEHDTLVLSSLHKVLARSRG